MAWNQITGVLICFSFFLLSGCQDTSNNPYCSGRLCGTDPKTGKSCGTCGEGETCNAHGLCECMYLSCSGICCEEGETCYHNTCCTPVSCDESNVECGGLPNGCGVALYCGDCGENGNCVDGTCHCLHHWAGSGCLTCPGNWDPAQNCAVCRNNWIDNNDNCGTCPDNWDPNQDCAACRNQWIDESNDCGTCPDRWYPAQDCSECMGNWDPGNECDSCLQGWIGPDCETCVRYVDIDIGTSGNGFFWSEAFVTVQEAIDSGSTQESCEVWVAEGTYFIYENQRTDTIQLAPGIQLYGGFDGTETSREERDWVANPTVLDGHASQGSTYQVYHVVTGSDEAEIDGFVITGGKADGSDPHNRGGGILIRGVSTNVRNCILMKNHSPDGGGILAGLGPNRTVIENCLFDGNGYIGGNSHGAGLQTYCQEDCSVTIRDSIFINNTAHYGGAVDNSHPNGYVAFESCLFVNNSAIIHGGAMRNYRDYPLVYNCTFYGNSAGEGGAIRNATRTYPVIVNSILWGNTPTEIRAGDNDVSFSVVQGGYTGFHNLDLNPTFKGLPAYSGSTWTSVTPEANGVQTTLTDSNASWTPGELSGLLLKPIASGSVLSYIIGNTATEIRIWGDVSGICNPGDDYEIYDFHLDAGSPCIDAANGFEAPELDIEMNPRVDDPGTEPNSGIGIPPYVDIGAYEYQP